MKIRYVQRVKRPDGRLALYFRKGDYREGPLRAPDASPELKVEVDAILDRLARVEAAKTPQVGTVGGLLRRYKKSAEFLSRAVSTKKEYERLIDEIEADVGDVLLRDVGAGWIPDLRDAWAARGHKAANDRVQMLRNAFKPAVSDKRIGVDPFAGLEKVAPPHGRGGGTSGMGGRGSGGVHRNGAVAQDAGSGQGCRLGALGRFPAGHDMRAACECALTGR